MLSATQYEKDAATLRKAMEGWGTDEGPIIELTAKRSNADRQQIIKYYKSAYGRDVIEDLSDELGGNLKKVVLGMFKTPIDYDCYELYKAMKGMGTDEEVLIEIIGTRNNKQLTEIKERFEKLYKKDLEKEVKDECSGDLGRLLVSLLQANRSEETKIDKSKVEKDATDLFNAGEGKCGTDEEIFNRIFALRSTAELRAINECYKNNVGKDLLTVISDEFSGDIKRLLKAILHHAINPADYFAERIYKACKGLGTNDEQLIRVMVSRDEIDLKEIKAIYPKRWGRSLYDEIKDETSGDYKNILLAIAMTD